MGEPNVSPDKDDSKAAAAPAEKPIGRGSPDCPWDQASVVSQLFFCFVDQLLDRGHERTLHFEDLDGVTQRDHPTTIVADLRASWDRECTKHRTPQLWRAILTSETVWCSYWVSGFWCLCESACTISQPVLVGKLVEWLTDKGDYLEGILWVVALLSTAFFQIVAHHALYYYTMRGGWNIRMGLTGMLHEKMLDLSSSSNVMSSGGKVVNLVANDAAKFDMFAPAVHFGWSGIMDLCIVAVLLYLQVGVLPMLAGIAVPVTCLPLQMFLGKRFGIQRKKTARHSDARINSASEVFNGIEMVKVQGWEQPLQQRTASMRESERGSIFISQAMKAINLALYFCSPALATLATFSVYWAQGHQFDDSTIFSTLSLLHVLRLSIGKNFARFVETFPEVKVSIERIEGFLLSEEHSDNATDESNQAALKATADTEKIVDAVEKKSEDSFSMGDATLSWSIDPAADDFKLHGLSLRVPVGSTLIVTGAVGSGKSAFLHSLLQETNLCEGQFAVNQHPIGYAPQQPWILAATIRENILFGEPFEEARYWEAVRSCGLVPDINALLDGDQTEIGDKGVNLSGGQRARVALARVAYSKAQLCLLDDPLSAVDPHVGELLFSQCIRGALRGRTVVLTTHHVKHVPRCDYHLALDNDGAQQFFGVPAGQFEEEPVGAAVVEQEVKTASRQALLQLVLPEDRATGDVTADTYISYIKLGGVCQAITVLLLFLLAQCCSVATDVWLSVWTDQSDQADEWLFYVLVGLTMSVVVAAIVSSVVFFSATLKISSNLHDEAFWAVLNAPLSFFTSNPLGRIMNKFSSDQGQVDEVLPVAMFDTLQIGFIVLGSLCLVCVAIPYLLILIPPLVWGFIKLRSRFLTSCREIKRMESITKSPLFSTFSQNLAGLLTIRAFGQQDRLQTQFEELLQYNGMAWYAWLLVNRWIGVRLDLLSFVVVFCAASLVVGLRDHIDAGLAALALVYCINLSGMFQYMVRQTAQVETMMTSVERILHYTRVPSEHLSAAPPIEPPQNWPAAGAISIDALQVRYREDLPLVLKGVTIDIPGGSSIGVVGRTGSGKSTMAASLFRLNQVVNGSVLVDGVDLSTVELHTVRRRMAFIPQQPALFAGTLRFNLDPFKQYKEAQIWAALDCVQLKAFVEASSEKLELKVAESGANLSVGQRQLISMARSMLSRSKVVVMDECTANVDLATDKLVQDAIFRGESFAGSTVIVIAHRIETIINCDQVLVLDQGHVLECDAPSVLLRNKDGAFAQMVAKANIKSMDTNKDGMVDAAEFAAAGGSKQEFDKYDLNGDGVLDADEMAERVVTLAGIEMEVVPSEQL